MMYEIEELVPVVAKLTERYTSGESTSVTHERARELMGAVQYCIRELSQDDALVGEQRLTAKEAYELGLNKVKEKVCYVTKQYGDLMAQFDSYGNINCEQTVEKAISGFLLYYDVDYEPQENIITMDYPTLISVRGQSGIDAMADYVAYIQLEQRFLREMSRENVIQILQEYDSDYREQFYNMASIVLRRILFQTVPGDKKMWVKNSTGEDMRQWFEKALGQLVENHYDGDDKLYTYLATDISEFVVELKNACQHDCIEHVFHIAGDVEGDMI